VFVVAHTDLCASADLDFLVQYAAIDHCAGADDRVIHDHRVAHHRARLHPNARDQYTVNNRAIDYAAVGEQGLMGHASCADPDRRTLLRTCVNHPVRIGQVQRRRVGQQRQVGFPIGRMVPTSTQ